jgi:hypothetical protein
VGVDGASRARTGLVLIGLTVAAVPLTLVWSALMLRAMGRVQPGAIGRFSPAYVRVWIKTDAPRRRRMAERHGVLVQVAAPGRNARGRQLRDQHDFRRHARTGQIGAETFFADGIYLGGADVRAGTVTLGTVELGRNTFLGNHAVIPANTRLPDDILVGISTVARPT